MNILIVAYDFPPVNRIAALRPYSFARYWQAAGHDVTVLCRGTEGRFAPTDRPDAFADLETIKRITVTGLPFTPKKHATTPENSAGPQGLSVLGPLLSLLGSRKSRMSVQWALAVQWSAAALYRAIALHERAPFDVVVSTFGPWQCHFVGSGLKGRYGSRLTWVADYRDLWSDDYLFNRRALTARFGRRFETSLVAKADLISTVSYPLVQALKNQFPTKTVIQIENGHHFSDGPHRMPEPTTARSTDGPLRLVYTGSLMLDGYNPDVLFDALEQLAQRHTKLAEKLNVVIYSEDKAQAEALIAKKRLGDAVAYGGYLGRREISSVQRNADGLLFFQWDKGKNPGHLTGKLFEYFSAGTPIIAIGGDPNTMPGPMIVEDGFGIAVGRNAALLATRLQDLLDGKALPYAPNPAVFERFDRKRLALALLHEIEQCRARRGAPS